MDSVDWRQTATQTAVITTFNCHCHTLCCTLLMQCLLLNNILLSFLNVISLPQIDTWPWIMHGTTFLPNDWTMFYLNWGQKAPRLWKGLLWGKPDTGVLCCGWNRSAHAVCWSDGGSGRSTVASLCAAAGRPALSADPARLHRTPRSHGWRLQRDPYGDVSAEWTGIGGVMRAYTHTDKNNTCARTQAEARQPKSMHTRLCSHKHLLMRNSFNVALRG